MNQGSLFEASNHDGQVVYNTTAERQTCGDEETSLEAMAGMIASGSFSDRCRFAESMVIKYPGRTGAELDKLAGVKNREVSKRLADVKRHKRICDPKDKRRVCAVKGTKAKTWWPLGGSDGG